MIGIIGYGVVGKAISRTMQDSYEIIKYDKFVNFNDFNDLLSSKFIFISVPTPFDKHISKTDDSAVIESLKALEDIGYSNCIIIKSTLPPGSCDFYQKEFNLNIVYNTY